MTIKTTTLVTTRWGIEEDEVFHDFVETRPDDGKYKIIIAGSRSLTNYDEIKPIIDFYLSKRIDDKNLVIMSGMAKGIDEIGHRYAKEHNIAVEEFPAIWKVKGKFDRSAGFKRNGYMAKRSDALLAIWNGHSSGTGHMINIAKKYELDVRIKNLHHRIETEQELENCWAVKSREW